MMPTKSLIYKLFLVTVVICCLTTTYGAKLPKTKTKSTAVAGEVTPAKSEVVAVNEAVETADDENDDDDDDEDDDDTDDNNSSEESDDAAEKNNALQPAGETSLGVWSIVRGVWNWIKDDIAEGLFGGDDDTTSAVGEGRTFGKIRRLQMALIPIIFKFGVLTAMVAFLVAIGLKTLFLVKVLLAVNVLALLSKFFILKTNFLGAQHSAPPPSWNPPQIQYSAAPSWSWSAPVHSGWSSAPGPVHEHIHAKADEHVVAPPQTTKEIHLHIHGSNGKPQVQAYSTYSAGPQSNGWERRSDPYSAYETLAMSDQNEVSNGVTSAIPVVNGDFPSNHRMF